MVPHRPSLATPGLATVWDRVRDRLDARHLPADARSPHGVPGHDDVDHPHPNIQGVPW